MEMKSTLALILGLSIAYTFSLSQATHFYGGNIRWKSLYNRTVRFEYTVGFELGLGPCGPTCNYASIGTFASFFRGVWKCYSGCNTQAVLGFIQYTITGVSTSDGFETGENSFDYTFADDGPFNVAFMGKRWRGLNVTSNMTTLGAWYYVGTDVLLGSRSDTGEGNNSPVTLGPTILKVQYGCSSQRLVLPLTDDDDDTVTCRWATGSECESICNTLPNTTISTVGRTCVINMNTNTASYSPDAWFGLAIMMEDRPRTTISVGTNTTRRPSDALSAIPLQFLVTTPAYNTPCDTPPVWITPTPSYGTYMHYNASENFTLTVYAQSSGYPIVSIQNITVYGPSGQVLSPEYGLDNDDQNRTDVQMITIRWRPSAGQTGYRPLCFQAFDTDGKGSEYRCVILWDDHLPEPLSPESTGLQVWEYSVISVGAFLLLLLLLLLLICAIKRCKKNKKIRDLQEESEKKHTEHNKSLKPVPVAIPPESPNLPGAVVDHAPRKSLRETFKRSNAPKGTANLNW